MGALLPAGPRIYAAEKAFSKEEAQIPKVPNAPPALNQKRAPEVGYCQRYFLFRGKRLECDSHLGNDGERLRPLLSDVPAALAELDAYQESRKSLKNVAYAGTGGLALMTTGMIISRPPFEPNTGQIRPGGYLIILGALLGVGSLVYGLSHVNVNDSHLQRAVQFYNQVHPEEPIELKFSTEFHF